MSVQKEIIKILYIFAQQQKKITITFGSLAALIHNYAQKFQKERPELEPLASNINETLPQELYKLEQEEHVKIRRGKSSKDIFSITYVGYFQAALKDWYMKMQENPDMAFPSKTFHSNEITEKSIVNINVSESFQQILRSEELKDNVLINLHFDSNVSDILIVKKIIHNNLEDICFLKLQQFLTRGKNSMHLTAKLVKDENISSIVNETIKNLARKPSEELNRFQNPSNNYYHLWINICKILNQQLLNISTQNASLEGQLQAVKLLHAFISFYYEQKRTKQIKTKILQKISDSIKLPPYTYMVAQLEMQATQEEHASTSISSEAFHEYISGLTQPNRISSVPEVIRFKTINGTEYVICSDNVLVYLNQEITAIRNNMREHFNTQIMDDYNNNKSIELLKKGVDIEPKIEESLKTNYPVIYSLLNYRIIELGIMANSNPDHHQIVDSLIDQTQEKLLPYSTIMQITPADLKKEAAYILPVWALVPVISHIIKLLMGLLQLFKSKNTTVQHDPNALDMESDNIDNPYTMHQEKTPVIAQRIVNTSDNKPNQNIKEKLEDLQEELSNLLGSWNTLIDAKARSNLTQDVNALCRDSIRTIWKGTGIPDESRVKELATRISRNKQFENTIQNKKALAHYMETYMNILVYKAQK